MQCVDIFKRLDRKSLSCYAFFSLIGIISSLVNGVVKTRNGKWNRTENGMKRKTKQTFRRKSKYKNSVDTAALKGIRFHTKQKFLL